MYDKNMIGLNIGHSFSKKKYYKRDYHMTKYFKQYHILDPLSQNNGRNDTEDNS